jgi:hypothetical protein
MEDSMLVVAGVCLAINLLLVEHHVGDVLENACFGVGAVILLLLVLFGLAVSRYSTTRAA